MIRLTAIGVLAVALCAVVVPTSALAARQPTYDERVSLTRAMPSSLRSIPSGCLNYEIRISTHGPYAYVGPEFLVRQPVNRADPCLRVASNGYYIFRRVSPHVWKQVWVGSDVPLCSSRIPRDLVTGCMCLWPGGLATSGTKDGRCKKPAYSRSWDGPSEEEILNAFGAP